MSAASATLTAPRATRLGESVRRLEQLVREATDACALDLRGRKVLTEAATGPYCVTPVLAALAGAEVVAVTADTPYGTVDEVISQTRELAERVDVWRRITITTDRRPNDFAWADIVTNSGHLRPIIGPFADAIHSGAVLSLMFESWEIQAGRVDLDLAGLRARGVRIAGTNERHPNVGVFDHLGAMAVLELADAGFPALGNRVAVLCDNPFAPYIADGLRRAGAEVSLAASVELLPPVPCDVLLVALTPTGGPVLSAAELWEHARRNPGAPVVQYWGDIDREEADRADVPVWPISAPGAGHMAVLPSRPGPDPIVRLQAGGLKVGEVLLKAPEARTTEDLEYVDDYL